MSTQCYYSENGVSKHFICSLNQQCCQMECCNLDFIFYKHWYFWVSIAVLVMFVVAAAISGYCKHRKPPPQPYTILGNNHTCTKESQVTLIPWAVALDVEPETP